MIVIQTDLGNTAGPRLDQGGNYPLRKYYWELNEIEEAKEALVACQKYLEERKVSKKPKK